MITDLAPYPAYMDSGLQWLGAIPDHWTLKRAKNLFRCIDVRSATGDEELLTVSSSRGVIPRRLTTVTMFKAESYVGHKLCWPNDLVINSLWAWARGLGVSSHHGIVSTAYGVYRLREDSDTNPRFVHALVRSTAFQWELQVRSKGVWTSRLQLTDDSFLRAPIPIPPIFEQNAIVRYLDHMDRRIGHYVRAKQRLINLLNEQKKATIHRAVTRGLDPSVQFKPSGVEWMGKLPSDWEVLPLRRRWTVTDCKHLTVPFVDDGIPLASVREAQHFDLSLADAKRTTMEGYATLIEGGREPRRGDLIYCRNVGVGAAAFVGIDERFAMGQDVCMIRSSDQNQRYLNYFLHSPLMDRQLAELLVGSTFPRINVSEVKGLLIFVPPRAEQDRIVDHLDGVLKRIERPIDVANREVSLLLEYRNRMITELVTGKLDVRALAKSLPDEINEAQIGFDEPETLFDEDLDDGNSRLGAALEEVEA